MELRTLRYFVAVLEAGSLSRAAATLYVAQPALSAQIKKLEAELDVRLFDRTHVGITPTEAGVRFYHDACRLLSDAADMRARAKSPGSGIEGSVTVAVPFLLAALLMGSFLADMRVRYPRIRIFVLDGLSLAVTKSMLDGRAEVGLLVNPGDTRTLTCAPIAQDVMFLQGQDRTGEVAALLEADSVPGPNGMPGLALPFAKAATLPLIVQSRRYSLRQVIDAAAAEHHVSLNIVHEHDSAHVIRSLHLAGAGYTFSPACALVDPLPPRDDWIRARVCDPELLRNYYLTTQVGRVLDEAAQAVHDALREHVVRTIHTGAWHARLLPPP